MARAGGLRRPRSRRARRNVVTATPREGQRIVAVTGGGGGIGAAIAEELGRQGAFVVTMDPLVTLDGSEALPAPEETTAGRIVAAGGSARATSVSVTDADAVRGLFEELGRLDAVVNVAGITRPTAHPRDRGRLGGGAVCPPGRLPEHPRGGAPDHGRRRARPDPRRHVRVGVAAGRHRRLRLRQARRRIAHLAARSPPAAGGGAQRHLTHRRDPHGHGGARAHGGQDRGSGHRRALARVDARARGARTVRRPPRGRGLLLVHRTRPLRRRVRGGRDRRTPAARGGAHRRRGVVVRRARRRGPWSARTGRRRPAEPGGQQPEVRLDLRRRRDGPRPRPRPCARPRSSPTGPTSVPPSRRR